MDELKNTDIPKTAGDIQLNSGNTNSRVDNFSGQHTTSLIVAILFLIVFIGYISVFCLKTTVDQVFTTSMISIMTLLIGFFTGTKVKKD